MSDEWATPGSGAELLADLEAVCDRISPGWRDITPEDIERADHERRLESMWLHLDYAGWSDERKARHEQRLQEVHGEDDDQG